MEQLLIMFVAFISNLVFSPDQTQQPTLTNTQPVTDQENLKEIVFESREYQYKTFKVEAGEKIEMYSNLNSKEVSEKLRQDNNCRKLINGGFYSEDNDHIGWLISNGKEISPYQDNDTLNGFINVVSRTKTIASNRNSQAEFGLQSGPMLIELGRIKNLQLQSDKARRRSFAYTTNDKDIYFGMITEKNSKITGPYLDDLPTIVNLIGKQEGVEIESAINLDGGTASAYHDETVSIHEINPIGSYICIKQ